MANRIQYHLEEPHREGCQALQQAIEGETYPWSLGPKLATIETVMGVTYYRFDCRDSKCGANLFIRVDDVLGGSPTGDSRGGERE